MPIRHQCAGCYQLETEKLVADISYPSQRMPQTVCEERAYYAGYGKRVYGGQEQQCQIFAGRLCQT